MTWADGDSADPEPTRCASLGPDLWRCAAPDGYATAGFVRRSGGMMITLTGPMRDRAGLLHAIRAAHPASDAELQPRSTAVPRTLVGWLLL